MLRFLIFFITILLLYFSFSIISVYDTPIEFSFLDYQVETTLFPVVALSSGSLLILLIFLRLLFAVFDLPSTIRNYFSKTRQRKQSRLLLNAFAHLYMNNTVQAMNLIERILPTIGSEKSDIEHLVSYSLAKSFDKRVFHLKQLSSNKHYRFFASYKLAEIFLENSHLQEAEEYGVAAFNQNDSDAQAILLLINIYARSGNWNKLFFVASKLQRADAKLYKENNRNLADYYYQAAKYKVAKNEDKEGLDFLEAALELMPDHFDSLRLYIEINNNLSNTVQILKILRAAYSYKPSFKIAELYIRAASGSAEAIYGTLSSLAAPKDHYDLYLTIAAFLNLTDKIKELSSAGYKNFDK